MRLSVLLACACAALDAGSAAAANVPPARVVYEPAEPAPPPLDPAAVSSLLATASAPANSPTRREARDRLFREIVPRLEREGAPATPDDMTAMTWAMTGTPCAGAPLRVAEAQVLGEAARVRFAGSSGACSALLRRHGAGWELVMVLGWTLQA